MANIKIKISNLYKVFGDDPKGAMEHVRKGATKQSLLDDHRHVLGLRDINIDIPEKKIQVVMGLSGSGKSTLIRHINRLIEPTEGQVIVDGEDVWRCRRRICVNSGGINRRWCSRNLLCCRTARLLRTPPMA